MTDSSEKLGGGGDGAEAEVAATPARVAWVKVGKIWWPGQVLTEDELTDEMRREVGGVKSRKSKGNADIHVVKFFNEEEYEVVGKPSDIIMSPDDDKKFDLVKRAISQMKSATLAENRPKFKEDVLHAERLLDPSSDLTAITKLLDGESLEPKKLTGASRYADIFPSVKPEKASPVAAGSTPGAKGKSSAVKFNFPSSRIISTASSKPPSKIAPLPSDPTKKYHCNFCGYSSDRVNVITDHMKFCKAKSPAVNSPSATSSSAALQKQKVTIAFSTPSRKVESPDIKPVVGTSPVKKPIARTPRGATPKTATAPMVKSPAKVAASVATSSIIATPTVTGVKKRGRRSKKDKMLSDKQKAEILQDWNDSSSEGEDDSDDELDMPPSKPPELLLFGSERNKKRKAEGAAPELDNIKVENGEGGKEGSVSAENGGGKLVDEDQPPVLKKPRTDKELSDAFEALLRTTKPEHDKLLGKDLSGEDEKMEVEEEEEEENNHLSDIEEDAMIVMKKVDVEDKEENKAENKKDEGEKEMEVVVEEKEKDEKEVEKKTEKEVESTPSKKKVEEEKPVVGEGRRTRRSRALVTEEDKEITDKLAAEVKAKEMIAEAKREKAKNEKDKQEKKKADEEKKKLDEEKKKTDEEKKKTDEEKKKVDEEKKKADEEKKKVDEEKKKADEENKKSEVDEVKVQVEVTTPAVLTRGRRSRRASKPEESSKVVEEVVKEKEIAPTQTTPVVARGRRGLRGAAAAENKAVEEVKKVVEEVEAVKKSEEKEEEEVKKEEPIVTVAKPVATLTPTLASTRSRRGAKPVPPVVEPVKETVVEKPLLAVKSQVKSTSKKSEPEKVAKKVVEEPEKEEKVEEPESVTVSQVVVQDLDISEPKVSVLPATPITTPAVPEEKKSEPVPVPAPVVAEMEVEKEADKGQLEPTPQVAPPPKASPKKAEVSLVTASKSKPSPPPPPTLAVAPSETAVVAPSPSKALVDTVPSPVKKAPTPVKESAPKSPAKSVVKPTPTEKPTPAAVPPPKPVQSPQKTKVTTPATTAVPPTPPQQVEQKSSPAKTTPKPTGVTTGVEQKPQVAATPAPSLPPPPPTVVVPPPPTVVAPPPPIVVAPPPPIVVAPPAVSPPKAQPQKKPTAAVRPLVEEISSAPSTVKEVRKGNNTAVQPKASPVPKEIPQSQQPPIVVQSSSQPVQQQGQQMSQQNISVEGDVAEADGKQSPALVAQRVVHLVPVENADGTITYMLLSLENGSENPGVVLEQGPENAGTVLRLDKVEPMDTSQGGEGTSPHANLPINPNEVEGIFLDKSVESANQIVSAIVSATGTATSTTDTASVSTGQGTIVIPEGATMSAAGGGQVGDGDPVTQQVFYMTEDGAIVDPQSLGLTLEQLQVLLNQSS